MWMSARLLTFVTTHVSMWLDRIFVPVTVVTSLLMTDVSVKVVNSGVEAWPNDLSVLPLWSV